MAATLIYVKTKICFIISCSWPWPILTFLRRSGEGLRTFRSSSWFVYLSVDPPRNFCREKVDSDNTKVCTFFSVDIHSFRLYTWCCRWYSGRFNKKLGQVSRWCISWGIYWQLSSADFWRYSLAGMLVFYYTPNICSMFTHCLLGNYTPGKLCL